MISPIKQAATMKSLEQEAEDANQDIDLNMKKRETKKPKRKKHRPKVIREAKLIKTPKSMISKRVTPRKGKRKYVQDKHYNFPNQKPLSPALKESVDPDSGSSSRFTRRSLNFDLVNSQESDVRLTPDAISEETKRDRSLVLDAMQFGKIPKRRRTENKSKGKSSYTFINSSWKMFLPSFPRKTRTKNRRKGKFVCSITRTSFQTTQAIENTSKALNFDKALRFVADYTSIQLQSPPSLSVAFEQNVSTPEKLCKLTSQEQNISTLEKLCKFTSQGNMTCGPQSRIEALAKRSRRCKRKKQVHLLSIESSDHDHNVNNQDMYYINEIIKKFSNLNINEQALVPYSSGAGSLVLVKKLRLRPKVNLDPESDRVWKFLMGKETNDPEKGVDNEKYWEEERRTFHRRVESFISYMHMIQGNRRFSQWKGSVLDSVIGVFLTQNVSDFLSSNSYMFLVANFPAKSTVDNETINEESTSIPTDTIKEQKSLLKECCMVNTKEQVDKKEVTNLYENVTTCTGAVEDRKSPDTIVFSPDTIVSSQNSSENPIQEDEGKEDLMFNIDVDDLRAYGIVNHIDSFTKLLNMANDVPVHSNLRNQENVSQKASIGASSTSRVGLKTKKVKVETNKKSNDYWESLRKQVLCNCGKKERSNGTMDALDYKALRNAEVGKISHTIKDRGQNNILASRIKELLDRLVEVHGSTDLEWLRHVPPDEAKEYLLSFQGLGLKSVECVRLLTLHHIAFPVDTNVARVAVRLGWVPLQNLPEALQFHFLELYPIMDDVQKYLWPRLCKLDQNTLYELHYQMITFGKVFCTKSRPNCNACPMRGECKHFASAFSSKMLLTGFEEKSSGSSTIPSSPEGGHGPVIKTMLLTPPEENMHSQDQTVPRYCEPIIEEPASPEPQYEQTLEKDIEDYFYEDPDEIPTIDLNLEKFTKNLQDYIQQNLDVQDGNISNALVAITPEAASIPMPKIKNVSRLRTEHQVYELPDTHPLLEGLDQRELDDPSPYLLSIWTPGETPNSSEPPKVRCDFEGTGKMCDDETCISCNTKREAQAQIVRGTLLIPCRTAMRGNFPLNGTYFQVNEVFADHESSCVPIIVPRKWLWNLPRRTVYFGTSITTIFRGLSQEAIQHCSWRGFVCVRAFERTNRIPKPLRRRFHKPASKSTVDKMMAAAAKEEYDTSKREQDETMTFKTEEIRTN